VKTILIVEDVELNRDLLVQLLQDDYRLVLAQDGESAVQTAMSERPDLVLMDLSLPRMDGWEATRRLKEFSTIPVIVLTAHAMRGDEERARAAGCDDFLTKPIDESLLFEKVAKYLGH
jgi:CheY-like chemotaxis protein